MDEIIAMELSVKIGAESQRSYDQFIQRQRELRTEIDKIRQANKDLRKEIKAVGKDDTLKLKERQKETAKLTNKLVDNENALRGLTKEQRLLNKEFDAVRKAVSSYDKLNNEVKELQGRIRNVRASGGIADPKDLARLKQLQRQLGKVNEGLGTFGSKAVGSFGQLKTLLAAGGIFLGLREITQQIFKSVEVFAEFEQQIAFLGAISRASGAELRELEADARRLGETTFFTATQVASLQTEFARFGFSATEIIQTTESALNVALATGKQADQVAKVIATSIRAYGIEAANAGQVSDTLIATLNSSGTELENFADASKFLAPSAKILGVSFEEASAAIGLLADNGLTGTIATRTLTTALQRLADEENKAAEAAANYGVEIFNQNGEFIGLSEVIKNVDEATKDFSEQQRLQAISQIFGQEAAKNFALLLTAQKEVITENGKETLIGAEALKGYTEQLEASNGEAARAAAIIGDTLNGDIKILQSSIEGLRLNFVDLFDGGIRFAIQGVTSLIQGLSELLKVPVSRELKIQQRDFVELTEAIIANYTNEEIRLKLLKDLQAQFPEYLKGVDLEKVSLKELDEILKTVNTGYEQQIRARLDSEKSSERLVELEDKRNTTIGLLADANTRLAKEERRVNQARIEGSVERLTAQLNKIDEERTAILRRQAVAVTDLAAAQSEANKKQASDLGFVGPIDQTISLGGEAATEKVVKDLEKTIVTVQQRREKLRGEIEALKVALQNIDSTDTKGINELLAKILSTENELNKLSFKRLKRAQKDAAEQEKVVKGSIGAIEKEIATLEGKLKKTTDRTTFTKIKEDITAAKSELDKLNRALGNFTLDRLEVQSSDSNGIADFARESVKNIQDGIEQALKNPLFFNQLQLDAEKAGIDSLNELIRGGLDNQKSDYAKWLAEKADLAEENEKEIRNQAIDLSFEGLEAIGSLTNSFGDLRTNREISAIERRYDRELELAAGNDSEITRITEERDARIEIIEREAFERQKQFSLVQAAINGALAITKILAETPKADFGIATAIQIALATATTAAQIASIESQTFALGGEVVDASGGGISKGASHKQGGMQGQIRGSNKSFEFEGNEGIINAANMSSKDVLRVEGTPRQIASAINSYGNNGIKFADNPKLFEVMNKSSFTPSFAGSFKVPTRPYFQDGGIVRGASGNTTIIQIDTDEIATKFAQKISELNLTVDVETFKKQESKFNQVINNSF